MKLANRVDTLNCVVRPDETGNFFGIANTTVEDIELRQRLVLGTLKPVQQLGRENVFATLHSDQMPPCYGIWQMTSQVLTDVSTEGDDTGIQIHYVDQPLLGG